MIEKLLTFSDLQHFIAIKFCFFAFLIASIVVLYKKWNPFWILFLAAGFSSCAYSIFAHGAYLPLFGLKADEITLAAMYNTFAHAGFFKDFSYHTLPPFYPPLFFWIFSIPGKFFHWNGIQIMKVASAVSIALFPLLIYAVQKIYSMSTKLEENEKLPNKISWILAPLFFYAVMDWDAIIGKPYEVISAALCVLWVVYLVQDVFYKRLNWKRILVYGLCGGVLFMTYYLWLIFGAVAVTLLGLFVKKQDQKYFYSRLVLVGGCALLVATPYLVPLVLAYHQFGSENWQIGFFVLEKMHVVLNFLDFTSWRGMFLLGGFMTLLAYRNNLYIRTLLCLFLTAYIWYLMGLTTLMGFMAPMQEFKGFDFFLRMILSFAVAFGAVELWKYIETKTTNKHWQQPVLLLGICILSMQLLFGNFIDNPAIQARRLENKTLRPTLLQLIGFLQKGQFQTLHPLTLSSGVTEISAFVPLNQVLYYNQFNSHPGAIFSNRKQFVDSIQYAKTPKDFYALLAHSPYGAIEQLILFQNKGKDFYEVYLYVDDFPHGAKEQVITFKKSLVAEPYFKKAYENYEFVIFELNKSL